jgi:hypothetical protein
MCFIDIDNYDMICPSNNDHRFVMLTFIAEWLNHKRPVAAAALSSRPGQQFVVRPYIRIDDYG